MRRCGGMADATDLKSVGPKGPCGFESRHRQVSVSRSAFRVETWSICSTSTIPPSQYPVRDNRDQPRGFNPGFATIRRSVLSGRQGRASPRPVCTMAPTCFDGPTESRMPIQKATKTAKILDQGLFSFFAFFAAFCLNLQRSSLRFGNYRVFVGRFSFWDWIGFLFLPPWLSAC
jgi:hypothetical protein